MRDMAEHPDDEATRRHSEAAADTLLAPTVARDSKPVDSVTEADTLARVDDTLLAPTIARTDADTDPDATVVTRARPDVDPDATILTRARADGDSDATVVTRARGGEGDSSTEPRAADGSAATTGITSTLALDTAAGSTGTMGSVSATAFMPEPSGGPLERELRVGARVKDRFVIEGILGKGGMGVVYRARDLRKDETGDRDPYVALKVLSDEYRRDPRMIVALQRESRKAQTLAHPNIATVFDFDRDGNIVYLTMEELDGKPLNALIREHPMGLPKAEAFAIIRGLGAGLAYAHQKNIIHSDFKPGNAFYTENKQVKILDFGIARAAPVDRYEASDQTRFDAGEIGALTPSYAAAEMFEGRDPHPADDVYALGIVAYQLLTGRHPFDSKPAPQARQQKLEPRPIKGLSGREWRAIRHGLAFDRAERSQNAAAFLAELEGGNRLRIVAAATVAVSVLFAGYAGYLEFRDRARALPDVPFEALEPAKQTQIRQALSDGAQLRAFGDEGSALILLREAYTLHPRNPEVVTALESLLTELAEQAAASNDPGDLDRLRENLHQVMAIDDFLGKRPALIEARDALPPAAE